MSDQNTNEMAFRIADASMMQYVEKNCSPGDEYGVLWIPVNKNGDEVESISEADEEIFKAVNWLKTRKLCDVVKRQNCDFIVLSDLSH